VGAKDDKGGVQKTTEGGAKDDKKGAKSAPYTSVEPSLIQPSGDTLPPWLPKEPWDGFVEMRKKIRKPLTDTAKNLIIKKLDSFRKQGFDVVAIVEESTMNCWQGVFTPKERKNGTFSAFGGSGRGTMGADEALAQMYGKKA
jgi:hypothetical protein